MWIMIYFCWVESISGILQGIMEKFKRDKSLVRWSDNLGHLKII